MAASVDDFRTRFPEFPESSSCDDPTIEMHLDDAILLYMGDNETRWNGKYNIAQLYLAAHLLHISNLRQAGDVSVKAGAISSKSAGGVSVTRDVQSSDRSDEDAQLLSTTYGAQYKNIRDKCFVGFLTAIC